MSSLGDVFLRILADANGFEADVVKKAGPAADRAGGKLGSRMGKALTTGIGALAGIGFATMLTGANELDAATRKLQADAGLTADEAAKAEGALAGMYQNNLQGFGAIGEAMAKVHNDLGLTGDAANAATEQFLKFSTATGQDAAEAVTQADDTLDAFNLTADHSGELLDKLIVSHQKWGGTISESQSALAKMAPALGAANLGLDDGIALLNLFNAAGVDAAKAPQALAKALGSVKSPAELQRLIKDISDTKDPFQRAEKAIKLFGARAGPQLAQALAQGNLADFTVSMEDAAGATNKASAAVESGFGAQATLMLHKFGGALAQVGTQFGPLIMVASQVGPGLLKGLAGAVGGIAGFFGPKLLGLILPSAVAAGTAQGAAMGGASAAATVATETTGVVAGQAVVATAAAPAAAAAGTGIGAAMGAAASLALGAALVVGVAALADLAKPYLDDLAKQTHDALFGQHGPFDDIGKAFDELPWPLGPKNTPHVDIGPLKNIFGGDSIPKAAGEAGKKAGEAAADGVAQGVTDRQAEARAAINNAYLKGKPGVTAAAKTMVSGVETAVANAKKAAAETAGKTPGEIADAITSKRDAIDGAMQKLKDGILHPLSVTTELAKLSGQLTSKNLAAGMRSADPAVRAQAEATKQLILARIAELGPAGWNWGKQSAASLAAGLKSSDPQIRASAQALKALVDAGLVSLPANSAATGANAGQALANGLRSKTYAVQLAALALVNAANRAAGNVNVTVTTSAGTHPRGSGTGRQMGGPVSAGTPYVVGERGPEWFVPQAPGVIVPHGAVAAPMASSTVNNITVPITGLIRAANPFEVADKLRRLAEFGVLTPRREPA